MAGRRDIWLVQNRARYPFPQCRESSPLALGAGRLVAKSGARKSRRIWGDSTTWGQLLWRQASPRIILRQCLVSRP
ncbi:hypothetical protein VTG60DRAFT_541 [Thermothelomyces hinnuleus]